MKYKADIKFNKNFIKLEENRLIIGIKSKPVGGKANEEVVRKIADFFKVPLSGIRIVRGRTSSKKIIDIAM